METKSRYEVIADLEQKKRNLIQNRDSLTDELRQRELEVKNLERTKEDTLRELERRISDAKEEVEVFKESLKDKKETNNELIRSVDDSLARFASLQKKE